MKKAEEAAYNKSYRRRGRVSRIGRETASRRVLVARAEYISFLNSLLTKAMKRGDREVADLIQEEIIDAYKGHVDDILLPEIFRGASPEMEMEEEPMEDEFMEEVEPEVEEIIEEVSRLLRRERASTGRRSRDAGCSSCREKSSSIYKRSRRERASASKFMDYID